MPKKVVFSDFYGTLSKEYISGEFLDFLHRNRLYPADYYAKQMQVIDDYVNQRISYNERIKKWASLWSQGLAGQRQDLVSQAAQEFYPSFRDDIYQVSFEIMREFGSKQYCRVIISAGAYEAVAMAGTDLGADHTLATKCEVKDGVYTGRLATRLHLPEGKEEAVIDFLNTNGFSLGDTIGMGDTEQDIYILEIVATPIALNPSELFKMYAKRRHWHVHDHESILPFVKKLR